MAARYDVDGRLAEGREAVAHTQTYVSAAGLRGYQHPDLTAHGTQVHDWYDGEAGMDLRRLDDDCSDLWAVVNAAEEALRVQRAQLGELGAGWSGPGADAAAAFLQRHCDVGAALVAGLRAATEACAALRDNLWRLIDDKVTAAMSIDDRSGAHRPVWLAAAHAVAGGDARAADVIDHQIKPYVDSDIGGDWVTAMRSARNAVAAAYDAAIAEVAPAGEVAFAVPDALGPRYRPDEPAPVTAPVPMSPAATGMPVTDPSLAAPDPVPPAALTDGPVPASLDDAAALPGDFGVPAGLGMPGGGLPGGLGLPSGVGGLGGLIPRIADAIGGLFGSPDDGFGIDEPFGEESEPDDAPERTDDVDEPEPTDDVDESESTDDVDETELQPAESADEVAADATADDAVTEPVDQQADPSASAEPDSQPDSEERTPCEIAAEELPQVGE